MKPNKLKQHPEMKDSEMKKSLKNTSVENLMKYTSSKRALLILLQCHRKHQLTFKIAHTIAEIVILPAATYVVQTFREKLWAGIGEEFPHLSRKALNILLPFATSYLCETGFSAVAAIKTKHRSMMNLKNYLRVEWPFKNFNLGVVSYVQRGNHVLH
jgi:hypothetical protein